VRDRSFSLILESCLQGLDRGESLPDLLADFPELADQLRPLLLVAMASRAFPVPRPSETAQRLGRNQMLAEMNRLEIKKAFRKKPAVPLINRWIGGLVSAIRARGLTRLAYSYRLAMVSLVLLLSGGYFTISASASSQPGDLLYILKLGMQRAGLVLSYDNGDEAEQPILISPQPWEFGHTFQALNGIHNGNPGSGSGVPDPSSNSEIVVSAADSIKEEIATNKDLKDAEKEAEKDLKDAEKEVEKDLKDAEKEAEKDLKDAEKEAEKDLKDVEKEAEKDLKDVEKEAEKDLKDAEKEAEKESKEIEKDKNKTLKLGDPSQRH